MPRELENYRSYLEQISIIYPGKVILTKSQIAKLAGVSEKTIQRALPLKAGKTTTAIVARWMCQKYG